LASRLGAEAVNTLLEGETCCTVGIVSDKVTVTPFDLAINGKKNINPSMIQLAEILAT
jgi:6-phosphofructokinase 1